MMIIIISIITIIIIIIITIIIIVIIIVIIIISIIIIIIIITIKNIIIKITIVIIIFITIIIIFITINIIILLFTTIGTRITSLAYGRLARRRAMTERALLVAAKAHPLLIRYSLRSVINGPKTFWYKKKPELDLLFENYLLLVEKLGYTPPRLIVEQNIQGK